MTAGAKPGKVVTMKQAKHRRAIPKFSADMFRAADEKSAIVFLKSMRDRIGYAEALNKIDKCISNAGGDAAIAAREGFFLCMEYVWQQADLPLDDVAYTLSELAEKASRGQKDKKSRSTGGNTRGEQLKEIAEGLMAKAQLEFNRLKREPDYKYEAAISAMAAKYKRDERTIERWLSQKTRPTTGS